MSDTKGCLEEINTNVARESSEKRQYENQDQDHNESKKKQKITGVRVVLSTGTQTTEGNAPADSGYDRYIPRRRIVVLKSAVDPSMIDKHFATVSQCLSFLQVGKSKYYDCAKAGVPCNGWYIHQLEQPEMTGERVIRGASSAGWNLKPGSRPRPITLVNGNQVKELSSITSACTFLSIGKPTFYKKLRSGKPIKGWTVKCNAPEELTATRIVHHDNIHEANLEDPAVAQRISEQNGPVAPVAPLGPVFDLSLQVKDNVTTPFPNKMQSYVTSQPQHANNLQVRSNPNLNFRNHMAEVFTVCQFKNCNKKMGLEHLEAHIREHHRRDETIVELLRAWNRIADLQKEVRNAQLSDSSKEDSEWADSAVNQWDFTFPNSDHSLLESPIIKVGDGKALFRIRFGAPNIMDKFRVLSVHQLGFPKRDVLVELIVYRLLDKQSTQATKLIDVSNQHKADEDIIYQISSRESDNYGKDIALLRIHVTITLI